MVGFAVFLIANIPSIEFFLPGSFLVNIGFAGVLFFCGFSRRVVKNDFALRLSSSVKLFLFLLVSFVLYGQISVFISFQYIDDYVFLQWLKYLYIVAVSALILIFAEKQDIKIFVVSQALWGAFVAVMSIAHILEYSGTQHYNTVATPIGASLIMFFSYATFAKSRVRGLLLACPFIMLLLLALISLPSRSALLFTTTVISLITLVDIYYTHSLSGRVLKISIYLMIGFLFFYCCQNSGLSARMYRIRMHRLFSEIGTEPRVPLLLDTVYKIIDNPLGYGLGSSMRLVGYYPHNMFLESLLEFGILPTTFFFLIAAVYPACLCIWALRNKDLLLLPVIALVAYLFLIFNTSYSVAHMYMYFSILSLAMAHQNLALSHTKRKRAGMVWASTAKPLL